MIHLLLLTTLLNRPMIAPNVGHTEAWDRLTAIRQAIRTRQTLSAENRTWVIGRVEDGDLKTCTFAILVLQTAAEIHLMPKSELMRIIEKRSMKANPDEASYYVGDYAWALGLGSLADPSFRHDWFKIWGAKKNPKSIDASEKLFVSKALSSRKVENRILAANVLSSKSGLGPKSLAWVLGQIKTQTAVSDPNYRQLWLYVNRVARARNG